MKRFNLGFIIIAVLLLIFLIILTLNLDKITGSAVSDAHKYSYTKAICKETTCQDYEIVCNGHEIISITPLTEAIIKISKDWHEPRPEKDIKTVCN